MEVGQDTTSKPPKRSRSGCHTCRVRKVKCKKDSRHEGSDDQEPCENCNSLSLECRWNPPKPGEQYSPPPKKRRLLGQRPRRAPAEIETENSGNSRVVITSVTQESPSATLALAELPLDSTTKSMDSSTDVPFDFDAHTGFDFVDLDLDGEGFDLIPLPSFDPAVLPNGQTLQEAGGETPWWTTSDLPVTATYNPTHFQASTGTRRIEDLSVNEDNRRLIQHYLEVMKGYAKVNDRSKDTDNVFISTFSMALSFSPLFYAILAFSAAHLAMEDPNHSSSAAAYAELAQTSYNSYRKQHSLFIEGLLSALFIRVKTIHVTGGNVDLILDLISETIGLINTSEGDSALQDDNGLAKRIITRLALLDSRASLFRLGGGKLIAHIQALPYFTHVFEPQQALAETPTSAVDVSCLLRADILRMRVGKLDIRLDAQRNGEFATTHPVRVQEIMTLYDDIQGDINAWDRRLSDDTNGNTNSNSVSEPPAYQHQSNRSAPLTPSHYARLTISCGLHAAFLYLHWIYPLPSHPPTASITTVLRHSLLIQNDPTRSASPSALLPSGLFLAGLCSTDPIHRDWILGRLRQPGKGGGGGGGGGGGYIEKIGVLLLNLWDMLDAPRGGGGDGGSGRQRKRVRLGTMTEGAVEQSVDSAGTGGGGGGGGGRGGLEFNIRDEMDRHCGGRFLI